MLPPSSVQCTRSENGDGEFRDVSTPSSTTASQLRIGLLNIQSLKPKLLELSDLLRQNQVDLMGLCETWLRHTTPDRLLVLPGYRLFRVDRPDGSGYGGVALVAKEGLIVNPLHVSTDAVSNSKLETLWVLIRLKNKRQLVICVAYRPPRRAVADIEADFVALENQYQYVLAKYSLVKIVICGDLNCDWLKPHLNRGGSALHDFVSEYSLSQFVTAPTYSTGSLLDVIMSNCSYIIQQCLVSHCHFSPHQLVIAFLSIPRFRLPRRTIRSRCLRSVDKEALRLALTLADWGSVFAAPTTSFKWERFLELFLDIFDLYAPARIINLKNDRAPPVCRETRELMSRRRVALARGGHSSAEYKTLNRAVRSAIRRDRCSDITRRIQEEGPNSVWRAIRSAVGNKGGEIKMSDVTPDELNRYFVSVGPRVSSEVRRAGLVTNLPCRLPRVGACAMQLSPLTLSELRDVVFHMKGSSACGEDGVTIHMIRMSFDAVGIVILHLINSSLTLSEVPSSWKHSLVFPAYKSGESTEAVNYRPISIVPVITKIVERAVHQQVYRYLPQNHLLSATQHGFRPRHSTETALITISDHILSASDRGEVSLLCMLDLSKCFDVISHSKPVMSIGTQNFWSPKKIF